MAGSLAAVVLTGLATASAEAARPPDSVTTGSAVVSRTVIAPTVRNYALVDAGTPITVSGKYSVSDTGSATDQIQIGWAGTAQPLGCIYNGPGSTSGKFTFDLGAPPSSGASQVIVNFAQNARCNTTKWRTSNAGPAIAEVAVTPADSGSSGPISVAGITINTNTKNSAVFATTKTIRVKGAFAVGDTGGAIDQIEVGWEGSARPSACAYNGGGNSSGTFNVSIGPPPHLGANYIVVDYAQNFSCRLDAWWGGTSEPPQTAAVGLLYDTNVAG